MTAANVYATAFVLACLFALILILYIVRLEPKVKGLERKLTAVQGRADGYLIRALTAERERDELRAAVIPTSEQIEAGSW